MTPRTQRWTMVWLSVSYLMTGAILSNAHAASAQEIDIKVDAALERFYKEEPFQLTKENGKYNLKLKLPFVSKKDVELSKLYEELVIRIGGFKRHILLPRQVASFNSVTAKMEGEYLNIVFEGDDHGREKE